MLVLYIHGFLSSPLSFKAQQIKEYCAQLHPPMDFACPALPTAPAQVMTILNKVVEDNQDQTIGMIGSSMGGYYATYLSQRYQLPAVLINPAVRPYTLMEKYLHQDLKNYHTEEVSRLNEQHVQELHALEINRLQYPALIWVLAQTGDETLDYRHAVARYQGCKQTIEQGGDHSFQGFNAYLPTIIEFLSTNH